MADRTGLMAAVVLFAVVGLIGARFRVHSRDQAKRERIMLVMGDTTLPVFVRNGFVGLAIWVPAAFCFALSAAGFLAEVGQLAAATALVGAVLAYAGFFATYVSPTRLMPRWLRDEVADGRVSPAKPSRLGWVVLGVVLVLVCLYFAVLATALLAQSRP
jgi:hypothetical protein